MSFRLACVVPGCRRTVRVAYRPEDGDEGLCRKHWPLAPVTWRQSYKRLRRRLTEITGRGIEGKPTAPYSWLPARNEGERVNVAWFRYEDPIDFAAHLRVLGSLRRLWRKIATAAIERAVGL